MSDQVKSELECYLRQYGWSYYTEGKSVIRSGWQGSERSYPLLIEVCETWVSMKVQPLLALNIDWETWPEIAVKILQLNDATSFVKLVIDPEGKVGITLEILNSSLSGEIFNNMLGILGYYADMVFEELLEMLDQVGFSYCESLDILT